MSMQKTTHDFVLAHIEELKVQSIQTAFFLQNYRLSDKLEVAVQLRATANNLFDGEPMILPIPEGVEDVPPEMPRIILRDKIGFYQCNVCGNRIDFFLKETGAPEKSITELWEEYISHSKSVGQYIKRELKARMWRLGLVTTFLLETPYNAAEVLKEEYLKENLFMNPFEVQINVLHKLSLEPFHLNRWMKLKSLREKATPWEGKYVQIQIDINTLQEEEGDYTIEEAMKFLDMAYKHVVEECIDLIHIGGENAER